MELDDPTLWRIFRLEKKSIDPVIPGQRRAEHLRELHRISRGRKVGLVALEMDPGGLAVVLVMTEEDTGTFLDTGELPGSYLELSESGDRLKVRRWGRGRRPLEVRWPEPPTPLETPPAAPPPASP